MYIPVVTKKSGGKRPGAGRKPGSTVSPPDDFFKLNDRLWDLEKNNTVNTWDRVDLAKLSATELDLIEID